MAFFVHVVSTGMVLGVDSTMSPDAVTERLGPDFAENHDGPCMWRDYGTIEFFWERLPGSPGWRGTHFSVQVHRLDGDPQWMNDRVRQMYGPFRARLRFEHLAAELAASGCNVVEVPRPAWDVREFAHRPTRATVLVASAAANRWLDDGDVWHISCLNPMPA
jgi:hypothetical protein